MGGVTLVAEAGRGLWVTAEEGAPVLWAFWDGPALPGFIQLGLASVACHNPAARLLLLTPAALHAWLDHVHPAFELLLPAHQADYARARLLDEFGGLYLDADSVGLAPLASLFAKLAWSHPPLSFSHSKPRRFARYEVVNISWPPDGDLLSITTMGPMRARSPFTAAWVTDLHLLLDLKLPALLRHKAQPDHHQLPPSFLPLRE